MSFLVWCARHQSLINLIKYATIRDQTWQSKTVNLFLFYRFRFPHFQVSFLFSFFFYVLWSILLFFYFKHSQKKKKGKRSVSIFENGWPDDFFFFLLLRWRWISMQMIPDRDNRQQNIYDIKKKRNIQYLLVYVRKKQMKHDTSHWSSRCRRKTHTHKRVVQQNCERDSVSSNIFFFLI